MQRGRVLGAGVVVLAGSLGGIIAGCVSNTASPPVVSDDGAVDLDSGAPTDDAGNPIVKDAATPPPIDAPSEVVDSTVQADSSVAADAADAGPAPAAIRFAWFVGGGSSVVVSQGEGLDGGPISAAGMDVCLSPHGSGEWVGPLLAASGLTSGLQTYDVTAYFQVVAGQYDARIVPAGSVSCDLPGAGTASADAGSDDAGDGGTFDAGGPADAGASVDAGPSSTDFTSLPAIASGAALTVVLVNPKTQSNPIADLFTFNDDTTASTGKAGLRFINVSESDQVEAIDAGADGGDAGTATLGASFGLGGGVAYTELFANVTSQEGIAPAPAATNGYVELAPVAGIDSTLTDLASGAQSSSGSLDLVAGTLLSVFYVAGGEVPALVWCYDGQPSATSSILTSCSFVNAVTDSVSSETRFGNFLADATDASVDVCVKYHSFGSYVGPLIAEATLPSGIPTDSLSAYFSLHGGFTFDGEFVAAGAADCSTSLASTTFTTYSEPGGGGFTSVLLTGYTSIPADAGTVPPYDAGPPVDAGPDAGPQPVSLGLTSLSKTIVAIEDESFAAAGAPSVRLVHLDAAHPGPMTLFVTQTGTEGTPSTWQLDDVPYGGFSTHPPPIDPWGYATMAADAVTLQIDATTWPFTLSSLQQSLFAYDRGGLQLLWCNDYDEVEYFPGESPLYTSCCIVGAENCAIATEGSGIQAAHGSGRSRR